MVGKCSSSVTDSKKNAAILDTKMAVTFELLALEQNGKVFWISSIIWNLIVFINYHNSKFHANSLKK